MAAIIALVIVLIASVKDNRLKAFIYSLPFPITAALFATKISINSSHIVGLLLLNLFLWSVFYLYKKLKISIIFSDFLCSIGYVVLGFIFVKLFTIGFWEASSLYFIVWMIFIIRYRQIREKSKRNKLPLTIKGTTVFLIALILLYLKSFLSGVVVTFPFSGVFAVWEVREAINTLAGEFTKNSLAILVFFIAIKIFSQYTGYYSSIGLGWLFYIPLIFGLQKIKS